MRSIISEPGQSMLPIPALGPHPRLDRVAAATFEQLSAALIFLSAFNPDAFDYAMDAVASDDENPGATGEAEPVGPLDHVDAGLVPRGHRGVGERRVAEVEPQSEKGHRQLARGARAVTPANPGSCPAGRWSCRRRR